jgi:hypothetical protein
MHMQVTKMPLRDGDGLGGQVCVVVNLARWQARHPWVQVVMSLDNLRHINLDEIILASKAGH